jgi:catechol 2,3-dioxygenase-like lactoylglutathione lyase family enzyme
MERFIADLVRKFETGTISRRDFCEGVALAAIVHAAGGAEANAAQSRGLKMLGVNHLSYACPDYRKARDFYSSVLGMEQLKDDGKSRVNLAFGPAPGKGGSFIVARNAAANPPAPARAVIDHVCYTISNWDDARVNAGLKAKGQNPTGRSGSVNVYDPFNCQVQLASAEAENPFI